jgi:hypothetical protein
MRQLQKAGGIAALFHAAALAVAMGLGVAILFPMLGADPGQYVAFLAHNQALIYVWNLVANWGSAASVVVMALAFHERMKNGSPALMLTATAFGLIWAALVIGSGNLMLRDVGVVADLYAKNPAQAETVWLALDAVETGIVSGNELVGSLWVALVCIAALRTGALARAAGYFGVAIALAGSLTIVPSLTDTMVMVFGPGIVVWSVWVGVILLREVPSAVARERATLMSSRQVPAGEGGTR